VQHARTIEDAEMGLREDNYIDLALEMLYRRRTALDGMLQRLEEQKIGGPRTDSPRPASRAIRHRCQETKNRIVPTP
jgi:hypothetical protein